MPFLVPTSATIPPRCAYLYSPMPLKHWFVFVEATRPGRQCSAEGGGAAPSRVFTNKNLPLATTGAHFLGVESSALSYFVSA
jgi:hypothetical protein